MRPRLKISVSGVRGVVGDTLTPVLLTRFARAFGTYMNGGRVLVGADTRTSGEFSRYAVISGLIAAGCKVLDVGIVPTPTLAFNVRSRSARGGICITASHNPAEWNALKFFQDRGIYLNNYEGEELLTIYHQDAFRRVAQESYHPVALIDDAFQPHQDAIFRFVDCDKIRARRFRVAVDCVNGAGSLFTQKFLEALGCEVTMVNDIPDGHFPHRPEPVPENLAGFQKVVVAGDFDIGFVQDPDADRLAILDENGVVIGEDYTVALGAYRILQRQPGPVVVNLSTSLIVNEMVKEFAVPVLYSRVGEVNVVEKMFAEKAVVGGEGSGGIIVPAVNPCRDSYLGMALVLELLEGQGCSVSSFLSRFPKYSIVKKSIAVGSEQIPIIMARVRAHYQEESLDEQDGLKILFADSWLHVRASNTEPIVRVVAEARGRAEAAKLVDDCLQVVQV